MDRVEDFEKVLSDLTSDLNEVGLSFDTCEIDVLDDSVDTPTTEHFEKNGFRYTTYRIDVQGSLSSESLNITAPFPGVIRETIERFVEDSPGNYRHVESFSSPLITRPNDLVATGPREFYVAQDTGQGTGLTVTDLIYFDGENYSIVADDIESGGGISASADYTTLYVAETNGNAVRVFSRNPDGTVAVTQRIDLGTAPDNVNVAEDGTLLIGGHSNLAALVMHFIMGSDSPSQIIRVDASASPPTVDEIYLNAGDEISAGSGADQYGNKLLIGSITDKKILVCEFD
jgi:hypothetical protein